MLSKKRDLQCLDHLDRSDQALIWRWKILVLGLKTTAEVFSKILKQLRSWIGSSFYLATPYISVQASLRPIHRSPDYLPNTFGSHLQQKRIQNIVKPNLLLLINQDSFQHFFKYTKTCLQQEPFLRQHLITQMRVIFDVRKQEFYEQRRLQN